MKTKKNLVLAAAALPLIFGTASAMAFGGGQGGPGSMMEPGQQMMPIPNKKGPRRGPDRGCHGEMRLDFGMMQVLGLSDKQKDEVRSLRNAQRAEMRADFRKHFATNAKKRDADRAQMQKLLLAKDFDKAAVEKLAEDMVQQRVQFRVEMAKRQHDLLNILTPAQKAKFAEMQNERYQECLDHREARFNR